MLNGSEMILYKLGIDYHTISAGVVEAFRRRYLSGAFLASCGSHAAAVLQSAVGSHTDLVQYLSCH